MRMSVCIPALFAGKDIAESLQKLGQAGFSCAEMWGWWDKDLAAINQMRKKYGIAVSAICTRFIPLTDPARRAEYLSGLAETIRTAELFDCPTIITQLGAEQSSTRAMQHQSIVDGLKRAAETLEETGKTLVIEPLNPEDHPGYYLRSSEETFEILEEVDSPHVKALFDIYHQQITEGNVLKNIRQGLPRIGHFHIAGVPGRKDPLRGELDYAFILQSLDEWDYRGAVGLEYFPGEEGLESLKTLRETWSGQKSLLW